MITFVLKYQDRSRVPPLDVDESNFSFRCANLTCAKVISLPVRSRTFPYGNGNKHAPLSQAWNSYCLRIPGNRIRTRDCGLNVGATVTNQPELPVGSSQYVEHDIPGVIAGKQSALESHLMTHSRGPYPQRPV